MIIFICFYWYRLLSIFHFITEEELLRKGSVGLPLKIKFYFSLCLQHKLKLSSCNFLEFSLMIISKTEMSEIHVSFQITYVKKYMILKSSVRCVIILLQLMCFFLCFWINYQNHMFAIVDCFIIFTKMWGDLSKGTLSRIFLMSVLCVFLID